MEDDYTSVTDTSELRQVIERFGATVDAYFKGADPGMDRARQYIHCLLRPARECLDMPDLGFALDSTKSAIKLLQAAQEEFQHIQGKLDPVGGPKRVRSIPRG